MVFARSTALRWSTLAPRYGEFSVDSVGPTDPSKALWVPQTPQRRRGWLSRGQTAGSCVHVHTNHAPSQAKWWHEIRKEPFHAIITLPWTLLVSMYLAGCTRPPRSECHQELLPSLLPHVPSLLPHVGTHRDCMLLCMLLTDAAFIVVVALVFYLIGLAQPGAILPDVTWS